MVDETGVDLFHTLPIQATIRPLTVTSGWRAPKKLLVANVQELLGSGRLKVASGLPEAPALQR